MITNLKCKENEVLESYKIEKMTMESSEINVNATEVVCTKAMRDGDMAM